MHGKRYVPNWMFHQQTGKRSLRSVQRQKKWQGRTALHSQNPCPKDINFRLPILAGRLEELEAECDLDDFFDELLLWSQTPLARQGAGMRQSYGRDMAQRLGFIKTQLSVVTLDGDVDVGVDDDDFGPKCAKS